MNSIIIPLGILLFSCAGIAIFVIKQLFIKPDNGDNVEISGGIDARSGSLVDTKAQRLVSVDRLDIETIVINSSSPYQRTTLLLKDIKKGSSLSISVGQLVYLGRNPGGEGVVGVSDSKGVSRKHCIVFREQGYLYVQDVGSANKTSVNNMFADTPIVINTGSLLKIGDAEFYVTVC